MKNNEMKSLESKINKHLAALPDEKRPELKSRSRAQSVAIMTSGFFEATDREGNVESVPAAAAGLAQFVAELVK